MASPARVYRPTPRNLALLSRHLSAGGLVAVPTETVYGLAADATSAAACLRIFTAKRRPSCDPLIVHIASPRDLGRVARPNAAALRLARKFWPGPLTLVLPKTAMIPDEATAGLPSVAVRLPAHPLFRRLIRRAGVPLAAPSANPFGYVSPTTADHVRAGLGSRIRHILDGGPSRIGLESTIVDLRDPRRPVLLRPGAITHAQIEKRSRGAAYARSRKSGAPRACRRQPPGQMARHYSPPATPVLLHGRLTTASAAKAPGDACSSFLAKPTAPPDREKRVLARTAGATLKGAARTLFATLRRLPTAGAFRRIHCRTTRGRRDRRGPA